MKKAVQQMMLGSICPSLDKTNDVLKKIKEAGYDGIELNSYMIHPTSIFVRALTKLYGMPSGNLGKYDWVKLLEDNKLEVISLHTDLDTLEKKYDQVVSDARKFNTNKIVITGMYFYAYHKKEKVIELAERLNKCGEKLLKDNLSLLYHNHNVELVRIDDLTAYNYLIEYTKPEYVNFEIDTYWFTDAGADPLKMMKKLGNRLKLWHITDRGIRIKKTPITPIVNYGSVELGYGNIDLDSLFNYGKENNIETVILESHNNWINNNPLDSIVLSAKYLENI